MTWALNHLNYFLLALGLTGVAIVMGLCVFAPTPGLEWFIPLLFLKLLISHLLREEPYLPDA